MLPTDSLSPNMTDATLATTNLLLAIVAIVNVLELGIVMTGCYVMYKRWQELTRRLDDFERQKVAPLVAKVNQTTDDFRSVLDRVNTQVEAVERSMEWLHARLEQTGTIMRHEVLRKVWPVIGLARGVRAAMNVMQGRSTRRT
jgi:hypothetical protein